LFDLFLIQISVDFSAYKIVVDWTVDFSGWIVIGDSRHHEFDSGSYFKDAETGSAW